MKYILFALMILSFNVQAFSDGEAKDYTESMCYAKAMIGYDSVINARLGVLPDDLVKSFGYRTSSEIGYIKVALGAYKWKGSPHQYANHIFYVCAQNSVKNEEE